MKWVWIICIVLCILCIAVAAWWWWRSRSAAYQPMDQSSYGNPELPTNNMESTGNMEGNYTNEAPATTTELMSDLRKLK